MVTDVIDAIKWALENMDKKYCKLSQIVYFEENPHIEKYLERPFAYEFYHQLRKLIEERKVDFGGPIVQPEVDKEYQHYFERGRIPDFIIHIPSNTYEKNLAVIEFKLASNINKIKYDLDKLVRFKQKLYYKYLIEVVIGNEKSLKRARRHINQLNNTGDYEIILIEFNTSSWKVKDIYSIKYRSKRV